MAPTALLFLAKGVGCHRDGRVTIMILLIFTSSQEVLRAAGCKWQAAAVDDRHVGPVRYKPNVGSVRWLLADAATSQEKKAKLAYRN